MKKQVLLLIMMVLPMVACAYDAEVDGLYYNFDNEANTATVTYKSLVDVYYNEYWRITTANIPAFVVYNGVTYSVTSIGDNAFRSCGLTSVTIPNSVTSIGDYAFYHCFRLTSVTIGNSVTSIGSEAFRDCEGLTSVTIPNSVTSIGDNAFGGCSGLTSVTIPNSVTSIGEFAFAACGNLTSIVIPRFITSIGRGTFFLCSLTSIIIPDSVTSIGENALGWSGYLADVYCFSEDVPETDETVFEHPEKATLHVPNASVNLYKSAEPWSKFGNIVPLTPEESAINQPDTTSDANVDWYTIDGTKLNYEPTEKGVYIVNGKKVYVK